MRQCLRRTQVDTIFTDRIYVAALLSLLHLATCIARGRYQFVIMARAAGEKFLPPARKNSPRKRQRDTHIREYDGIFCDDIEFEEELKTDFITPSILRDRWTFLANDLSKYVALCSLQSEKLKSCEFVFNSYKHVSR